VPPQYLSKGLRHSLVATLTHKLQLLEDLLPDNGFVIEQRARLRQLLHPAPSFNPTRPRAANLAGFPLDMLRLGHIQSLDHGRRRQLHWQLQALAQRLRVDELRTKAELARLLGDRNSARLALGSALQELASCAQTRTEVQTETSTLREQLAEI
jgi:hypothetical protein